MKMAFPLTSLAVFCLSFILAILMTPGSANLDTPTTAEPHHHNHHHRQKQLKQQQQEAPVAECQEVSEHELTKLAHEQLSTSLRYRLHESFYQTPGLRAACEEESLEQFRKTSGSLVQIRRQSLQAKPRNREACKTAAMSKNSNGSSILDPCPMHWVLNVDPNRIPKVLMEGKCFSCSCMNEVVKIPVQEPKSSKLSAKPQPQVAARTTCTEVYYYTKVLRKSTECNTDGKYRYMPIWEPITIGCACREPESKLAAPAPPDQRIRSFQRQKSGDSSSRGDSSSSRSRSSSSRGGSRSRRPSSSKFGSSNKRHMSSE